MLLELEIKDFALIDQLQVSFSWGLNVVTGETGAGKSILMDALNTVLGGRVGPNVIRPQAQRAVVEAVFRTSPELKLWLKENQLSESDEENFSVSREISKNGSKSRINGSLVNSSLLQELRQRLVTVHAQHEARTLLSAQAQLEMIDSLAEPEHKKLLANLKSLYGRRKDLLTELADLQSSTQERERRLDFARFQLAELQEAQLSDPEEDELIGKQRRRLSHLAELETAMVNAQIYLRGHDLDEQPGALELMEKAACELARGAELDESLKEAELSLRDCLDRVEEETRHIRKYCQSLNPDPETLAGLDERAAQLAAVKRKYGPLLQDAIRKEAELAVEIDGLSGSHERFDKLKSEVQQDNTDLLELSLALSERRRILALNIAGKIQKELADLSMGSCKFEIKVTRPESDDQESLIAALGPSGIDRVEFLICPNPGQPLLPLSKIASGGELSRIMLAIKTIFAGAESTATVIFDEIDTGLSGSVLQTLRNKLAALALDQQILCVTHQALIASVADNHLYVYKEQDRQQTCTRLKALNQDECLSRLAEMAAGQGSKQAAINFAGSLLQEAEQIKRARARSSSYRSPQIPLSQGQSLATSPNPAH